jgi:hypothetical protein
MEATEHPEQSADCTDIEGGFDQLNYGTIHGQKLF